MKHILYMLLTGEKGDFKITFYWYFRIFFLTSVFYERILISYDFTYCESNVVYNTLW